MTPPTTEPTMLYKWTDEDGRSCHGGDFQWSLPTYDAKNDRWTPGNWTPRIVDVVPCTSGYHLCRPQDLRRWIHARCWIAEVRGPVVEQSSKTVVQECRLIAGTYWDEFAARLFAVQCAADMLDTYERAFPNYSRVSDALVVGWLTALGETTAEERSAATSAASSAASSAAYSAASSAASSAAYSAASSAQNARLLAYLHGDFSV